MIGTINVIWVNFVTYYQNFSNFEVFHFDIFLHVLYDNTLHNLVIICETIIKMLKICNILFSLNFKKRNKN